MGAHINISEDFDARQSIAIRRREVWKDTLRAMRNPYFDFESGFNVTFISESAVDEGGPFREYVRLLMRAVRANNSLFCGQDNQRTAMHNIAALHKKEYEFVGKCIALSVLYNGPGPHFFSETATHYLLDLPIARVPLTDIPDAEVVEKLWHVRIVFHHFQGMCLPCT